MVQDPVWRQIKQFALIVADQGHGFLEGVKGLDRSPNGGLHCSKRVGDLFCPWAFSRFKFQNFRLVSPPSKSGRWRHIMQQPHQR